MGLREILKISLLIKLGIESLISRRLVLLDFFPGDKLIKTHIKQGKRKNIRILLNCF